MLRRIRDWLSKRREWRRAHDAAWSTAVIPGRDGISPYMAEARADVLSAFPQIEFELAGQCERFFRGALPGTDALVYIYCEGAQIHAREHELFWAEFHDYSNPQELNAALVAAAQAVQPNNSSKPTPLRGAA